MLIASRKKDETPWLDNILIAAPCSVSWESMSGDDRKRACSSCSRNVYNLSTMTTGEAEAFLRDNGVKHCVTFYRRGDGTIMTDNCPVGLRKIRDKWREFLQLATLAITFFITPIASFAQGHDSKGAASNGPALKANYKKTGGQKSPKTPVCKAKPVDLRVPQPEYPNVVGAMLPYSYEVEQFNGSVKTISNPDAIPGTNDAGGDKEKGGKDPYYKLHVEFSELADPTAFNLFLAGKRNLEQGKVIVARTYFKAALQAFDATNYDWKLKKLVEDELAKADKMPLTAADKEAEDDSKLDVSEDGKPRVMEVTSKR